MKPANLSYLVRQADKICTENGLRVISVLHHQGSVMVVHTIKDLDGNCIAERCSTRELGFFADGIQAAINFSRRQKPTPKVEN